MPKNIANPEPEKVLARTSECMRRLMEAGLTFDDLQKPIDDPDLRESLVSYWQSGGFQPSTSQKRAQQIMGKNFFGVEEAIEYFRISPTKSQLATLTKIPFSEETLEYYKETHILVAVFLLSIFDIYGKRIRKPFHGIYDDDRIIIEEMEKKGFARDRGEIGWRLVSKHAVPNSTSKTWNEQQDLLGKNEETPSAQVMVYTIIGHYLATGESLFEELPAVRTSSIDFYGHHVCVDNFRGVCRWWDSRRDVSVGVSSEVKVA